MMTLLDGLHRIFGRDASPAARAVREAGMALLNAIPPLKQQVAGFAMGLHRK
jgi:polyribonucleotide nucleotidyltransferase